MPIVSIIIPTFNNENTIERTLKSVLKQSFSDFEILVVDNGSTDETINIIKKYAFRDSRIKLLKSARGRSKARNIGLKSSTAKYIQLLDSDDEICSLKIERAVSFLEKNNNFFAYNSSSLKINDIQKTIRKAPLKIFYKNSLLGYNPYRINCPVFRNQKLVNFDESLHYCEDWLFWVNNFWGKKVFNDVQHFDAVVHITGINSSVNVKYMLFFDIFVRCLIKGENKKRTLRLFIRDVKLAAAFLLVDFNSKVLTKKAEKIKQYLGIQIIIVKAFLHLPFINKALRRRVQKYFDESDY